MNELGDPTNTGFITPNRKCDFTATVAQTANCDDKQF